MHRIGTLLATLCPLLLAQTASAAPGDTHYVQRSGSDVRTGPGKTHSVLMTLGQGHELIEYSRQDGWINVGIARTGGKNGWIRSSLVGPASFGVGRVGVPDTRFNAFKLVVEKINAKVEPIRGFPFFTKVENKGDGIVQITAHERWLASSRDERESNLNTLFDLWSRHEASDRPIAVIIADPSGNPVMKRARP